METVAYVVVFVGILLTMATFANFAWWGLRLHRILQQKYPSTWAEITTLWGMPGMRNSFRSIPWLLGPDYCGDEEVRRLKKATLWSSLIVVAALTVIPGMIAATFVIVVILKAIFEGT